MRITSSERSITRRNRPGKGTQHRQRPGATSGRHAEARRRAGLRRPTDRIGGKPARSGGAAAPSWTPAPGSGDQRPKPRSGRRVGAAALREGWVLTDRAGMTPWVCILPAVVWDCAQVCWMIGIVRSSSRLGSAIRTRSFGQDRAPATPPSVGHRQTGGQHRPRDGGDLAVHLVGLIVGCAHGAGSFLVVVPGARRGGFSVPGPVPGSGAVPGRCSARRTGNPGRWRWRCRGALALCVPPGCCRTSRRVVPGWA